MVESRQFLVFMESRMLQKWRRRASCVRARVRHVIVSAPVNSSYLVRTFFFQYRMHGIAHPLDGGPLVQFELSPSTTIINLSPPSTDCRLRFISGGQSFFE